MIATVRQRALFVVALIGAAAAFLLPQLWLFSLSLKSKAGLFEYPPTWLPRGGSAANYRFVLTHTQVPWYLWNSLIVAAFASVATLAVAVVMLIVNLMLAWVAGRLIMRDDPVPREAAAS